MYLIAHYVHLILISQWTAIIQQKQRPFPKRGGALGRKSSKPSQFGRTQQQHLWPAAPPGKYHAEMEMNGQSLYAFMHDKYEELPAKSV